jgi:hypothetical protein
MALGAAWVAGWITLIELMGWRRPKAVAPANTEGQQQQT